MKLLLDTHALIWWLADDPALGAVAAEAIGSDQNQVFVSAVSAFEVTTKYRLGKLPQAALLAHDFENVVAKEGFAPLPLSLRHGQFAGTLEVRHKDPFDRMLIAQALLEEVMLVSNEKLFDEFGVRRLW